MGYKYPVKPYLPVFNPHAPGASDCDILLPFAGYEKGRRVVKNIAPKGMMKEFNLDSGDNLAWSNNAVGTALESPDFGNEGFSGSVSTSTNAIFPTMPGQTIIFHLNILDLDSGYRRIIGNSTSGSAYLKVVIRNDRLAYTFGGQTLQRSTGDLGISSFLGHNLWIFTAGSRGLEFYFNGNLKYSHLTVPSSFVPNSADFRIMGIGTDTQSSFPCKTSLLATYHRQFSVQEINDISSDPWCMIRPPKPHWMIGGITSTVDTMTLIPVSAAFSVSSPILSATDTLTLSPVAATFSAPSPSSAATDTATLSAVEAAFSVSSPSLDTASTINLSAVDATFSVAAPSLSVSDAVALPAVEATFSVVSPSLSATDAVALPAVAAAFSVALPELDTGVATLSLLPVAAACSVSSPSLSVSDNLTLSPVSAAFSVSSPGLSVSDGLSLSATSATFSVSTPGLDISTGMSLLPVAATLSVVSPSLSVSDNISLSAVDAAFSIASPGLVVADNIALAAVDASFTIASPGLSIPAEATIALLPIGAVLSIATPSLNIDTTCPGLVGRVYDIIDKLGKTVDFEVIPRKEYDSATGHTTEEAPITVQRKISPPVGVWASSRSNMYIKTGSMTCYLASCGLPFTPEIGVKVTIDATIWKVGEVKNVYTTTGLGAYELELVR